MIIMLSMLLLWLAFKHWIEQQQKKENYSINRIFLLTALRVGVFGEEGGRLTGFSIFSFLDVKNFSGSIKKKSFLMENFWASKIIIIIKSTKHAKFPFICVCVCERVLCLCVGNSFEGIFHYIDGMYRGRPYTFR